MTSQPTSLLATIVGGLMAGGLLAALAIVAVPDQWRSPAIPIAVGVLSVVAAIALRSRANRDGRGR